MSATRSRKPSWESRSTVRSRSFRPRLSLRTKKSSCLLFLVGPCCPFCAASVKPRPCSFLGPFTPGCTNVHLPAIAANFGELKAKGVDIIACLAVSNPYVMEAWKQSTAPTTQVLFLCMFVFFEKSKAGYLNFFRHCSRLHDRVHAAIGPDLADADRAHLYTVRTLGEQWRRRAKVCRPRQQGQEQQCRGSPRKVVERQFVRKITHILFTASVFKKSHDNAGGRISYIIVSLSVVPWMPRSPEDVTMYFMSSSMQTDDTVAPLCVGRIW